jgi:hypothetical protein
MIENAIQDSLTDHLPEYIYQVDGMSSRKTRNLLNRICDHAGFNYLEVGTWKGSTLISSLYKNDFKKAYCIDNWSEYGDVSREFWDNLNKYLANRISDIKIIESDCFESIDLIDNPIDVFLYDGAHDVYSQEKALNYFYPVLNSRFTYIVDDYNQEEVREGTKRAIDRLGLKIKFMTYLPSRNNCDNEYYWNGIAVFIFKK